MQSGSHTAAVHYVSRQPEELEDESYTDEEDELEFEGR